jgi:hypothetical protein
VIRGGDVEMVYRKLRKFEVLGDRLRHDKPLFPVGSYTQEPFLPKHLLYRITLQDIHIHDRYILFHLTFILHFSLHCRTTT